ncbi:MAG: multiheme c-type cytochrome [Thermodesulfobacteriota bacterium]
MKSLKIFSYVFFLLTSPALFQAGEASLAATNHWARPVITSAEGSISPNPETCKKCHTERYADWSGSLHSKSVSPGLLAQLDPERDPAFAISCYLCHAPAVEQREVLSAMDKFFVNEKFDEEFKMSGVSCAACHLRGGRAMGPKDATLKAGDAPPAHPSEKEPLFSSSEFCKACHQMDRGFEINGKLLTNTYNEWKESYYGDRNITCQNCHMPGGRHLFRGIHDKEMTANGLKFTVKNETDKEGIKARLTITNVKVGHYFPTYVTPLVVVRGFLTDADGEVIDDTMKKTFIGRQIPLDLSKEVFDTRIAPLESTAFVYLKTRTKGARKLTLEVWVLPDEFYTRFFTQALKRNSANRKYKEALKITKDSAYQLYKKEFDL